MRLIGLSAHLLAASVLMFSFASAEVCAESLGDDGRIFALGVNLGEVEEMETSADDGDAVEEGLITCLAGPGTTADEDAGPETSADDVGLIFGDGISFTDTALAVHGPHASSSSSSVTGSSRTLNGSDAGGRGGDSGCCFPRCSATTCGGGGIGGVLG